MWSSNITEIVRSPDGVRVRMQFANGAKSLEELVTIQTMDELKTWTTNRLALLEKTDTLESQLVQGPFDASPTPPSQDEIDKLKYFSDLASLNNMVELIAAGVKKNTDQDFVDLQALVKSEFKPEYV